MYTIDLIKIKFQYINETRTFKISERDVPFATEYVLINPKTNGSQTFKFSHSTGPEFDPNTEWIYKSSEGLTLSVCNDKIMTEIAAQNYLNAKLSH